jgi:hypothetical protein
VSSEASPQEACVVHGEAGKGGGLLGGLLGGGHHRQATHPRRLETLPLGRSSFPTAMTYPRKLLFTEVRGSGVLGSSHQASVNGTMLMVERLPP